MFPKWSVEQADRNWCAGFVYYCCVKAGFLILYSPDECVSCSLAGCGGWEDFALGDKRIEYHIGSDEIFTPDAGDIVLYNRVFNNLEHDHIGIVLENKPNTIIVRKVTAIIFLASLNEIKMNISVHIFGYQIVSHIMRKNYEKREDGLATKIISNNRL